VPSSPANYFHLLRRHASDGVRRPLIVFTPKSMLRNKAAVSKVEDFTSGGYRPILDDPSFADRSADSVTRVLLCAGKVYYELVAAREKAGRADDIAIVRMEQLYPVATEELTAVLDHYPNASDHVWVQEEPANQGAWPFLGLWLNERMNGRLPNLRRVSRRRMAAPAAGVAKVHEVEQKALIAEALAE
jgi:2-oxoglutarate decarboxylase